MKTTGDHLIVLVRKKDAARELLDVAEEWLKVDRHFTKWIHETAKPNLDEDAMVALADAETAAEKRERDAWNSHVANVQGGEAALIECLRETIELRKQTMKAL
jgi:hypothetical protein